MFYCESCAEREGWPKHGQRTTRICDECNVTHSCFQRNCVMDEFADLPTRSGSRGWEDYPWWQQILFGASCTLPGILAWTGHRVDIVANGNGWLNILAFCLLLSAGLTTLALLYILPHPSISSRDDA